MSLPAHASNELKTSIYRSLDENGALNEVRARIRAEIFKSLEPTNEKPRRSPLTPDDMLCFELIRDWLDAHGLAHSSSVLAAEAGQPEAPVYDRKFLMTELGLSEKLDVMHSKPVLGELIESTIHKQQRSQALNDQGLKQHLNKIIR